MTTSQRKAIRLSEIRERLNVLLNAETRSAAEDTELTTLTNESATCEREYRAAVTVESDDAGSVIVSTGEAETRARRELRSRTGIADFLRAAAGGSRVTGAAAEYAAEVKCSDIGHLPLSIFERDRPAGGLETRAITPGPAVDGPVQPRVPYVFERSAAASLGIMMPTVGAGAVQIPRISVAPPSDTLAKDAAALSTAATVVLDSQSPKRVAGSFEVRVEDLAVYAPLENDLREALSGAMANELDEEAFNGDAAGLNGLFTQATNVAAAGAVETFTSGIARFAAMVDGRFAYDLSDLHAVIGSKTFALYSGLFANANKGDISLYTYLKTHMGSIRVSDRVPAVASTAQKGIVVLTAAMEAVKCYVWDSMEVIRDPYSGAGAGKVTITATALVSEIYIPHGVNQVKEVHPKLS